MRRAMSWLGTFYAQVVGDHVTWHKLPTDTCFDDRCPAKDVFHRRTASADDMGQCGAALGTTVTTASVKLLWQAGAA